MSLTVIGGNKMIKEIKEIKTKEVQTELARLKESEKRDYGQEKRLELQINLIKNASTLEDLGLNFQQAIQILEKNNIPLILGEDDKIITQREDEFKVLEDFMLVHVTRFAPTESKIKSPKESGAIQSGFSIKFGESEYSYDIPYMRDTVHFTVNNEVNTGHGYLDCDDCRYAVLTPLADIPTDRMKGEPADMYTMNGGANLTSNSYILCPKGQTEELMKNNPGVNIIEYEGESVRGYATAFLSTLGYRQSDTESHSFRDEKDSLKFIKIMQKHGIELAAHFTSKEAEIEYAFGSFEKEIAIYRIIRENGLIQDESDMPKIMEQLREGGMIKRFEGQVRRICEISSEEQKQYFLQRTMEEKLDLTSILEENGKWRSGDILETAIKALLTEKAQVAKKDFEDALKAFEKNIISGEQTISIEQIYNQFEANRQAFPTYISLKDKSSMLERIVNAIETIDQPSRMYQLKSDLHDFMQEERIKNSKKKEEWEVVTEIFYKTESIIPPPPTNIPVGPNTVLPPPPPPPSFLGTKADIKTNIIDAVIKTSEIQEARQMLESDLKEKTEERDGGRENG